MDAARGRSCIVYGRLLECECPKVRNLITSQLKIVCGLIVTIKMTVKKLKK